MNRTWIFDGVRVAGDGDRLLGWYVAPKGLRVGRVEVSAGYAGGTAVVVRGFVDGVLREPGVVLPAGVRSVVGNPGWELNSGQRLELRLAVSPAEVDMVPARLRVAVDWLGLDEVVAVPEPVGRLVEVGPGGCVEWGTFSLQTGVATRLVGVDESLWVVENDPWVVRWNGVFKGGLQNPGGGGWQLVSADRRVYTTQGGSRLEWWLGEVFLGAVDTAGRLVAASFVSPAVGAGPGYGVRGGGVVRGMWSVAGWRGVA